MPRYANWRQDDECILSVSLKASSQDVMRSRSPAGALSPSIEATGAVVTLAATCDHLEVKESKQNKGPPTREGFFNQLTRESERGTALIAGEACNERLGMMLGLLFVEGSEPNLLRHPLGNFSSRINICFALGLISSDERDDLRLVAKIRNSAAHFAGGSNLFSFSEEATANACRSMRATSPPFMAEVERDLGIRGQFIGKFVGLFSALDARMNVISRRDAPRIMNGP